MGFWGCAGYGDTAGPGALLWEGLACSQAPRVSPAFLLKPVPLKINSKQNNNKKPQLPICIPLTAVLAAWLGCERTNSSSPRLAAEQPPRARGSQPAAPSGRAAPSSSEPAASPPSSPTPAPCGFLLAGEPLAAAGPSQPMRAGSEVQGGAETCSEVQGGAAMCSEQPQPAAAFAASQTTSLTPPKLPG